MMTTSEQAIISMINAQVAKHERVIVRLFATVGEQLVNQAKDKVSLSGMKEYKDRTSNLVNSIGFMVLKDGSVIAGKTSSGEGGQHATQRLNAMKTRYGAGIVLIVVAGMEYASAVEAKGFEVLTSAELSAPRLLKRILREAGYETT